MRNSIQLLLLLFFSFFFSNTLSAQKWGRITSSTFTNEALDLVVDNNGFTYTTGYITGETAFGVNSTQVSALGNGDIYVAKYNPSGTLVWVKQFGGSFSDRAYEIAVDQANNVYIAGQYYGSVAFGATTLQSSNDSKDIFLAKLDASGNVLWATSEGGDDAENVYGLEIDAANSVIMTGQFRGVSKIGGQIFTSTNNAAGNPTYDLFISKYNTQGQPLWTKTGLSDYENRGLDLATDSQNNIFLTAQVSGAFTLDGQLVQQYGMNSGLLAKFSPNGTLDFANLLNGGMIMAYALAVNSANEVIVGGDYLGSLVYNANGTPTSISNSYDKKMFLLKTSNTGSFIWERSIGSDNTISLRDIAIDSNKRIYSVGQFSCNISELHAGATAYYNSIGFLDGFLWTVSDKGDERNLTTFGSRDNDMIHGVDLVGNDSPVICGGHGQDLHILITGSGHISQNDFDLSDYLPVGTDNYRSLKGDLSRNSFVTTAIVPHATGINFFNGQPSDSLIAITQPAAPVEFCGSGFISINPLTNDIIGPAYDYVWSNGGNSSSKQVNYSGFQPVKIGRKDACSFGLDTVDVLIHPEIDLPSITDGAGMHPTTPGPNYPTYTFCIPDSLPIWFSAIQPHENISIIGPSTAYFDTLPHHYTRGGNYLVTVSDSNCSRSGTFTIIVDEPNSPDFIAYMTMLDLIDFNDSISVCPNESIQLAILDSLENTTGDYNNPISDTVVRVDWSSNLGNINTGNNEVYAELIPTVTGWYVIKFDAVFGYDNSCGVDTVPTTVIDSFYIEVYPADFDTASIIGDNQLCPNGSIYLFTTNVISGFNWSGPGISWTSPNLDSVQVTSAGHYTYHGMQVDSLYGCTQNTVIHHNLIKKTPPPITADPVDLLVCPNDSVRMTIPSGYVSYDWTGPAGSNLSNVYEHYDDEQGFYYVTVVDYSGCALVSPPVELREYSTPTLIAEPTNAICDGEEITLRVFTYGVGDFHWTTPVNSYDDSIIVSQPGWYFVEITQCDTTVVDSIYIHDGSFKPTLIYNDSVFCHGEEIILATQDIYDEYTWSNGEQGVHEIIVDIEGDYYVTVVNSLGCEGTSDTLFIDYVEGSQPPNIPDVSLCLGDSLLLTNPDGPVTWYTADSILLFVGSSIFLPFPLADTNFLLSYNLPGCEEAYAPVNVTVSDSIPQLHIDGDLTLCADEQLELSVNSGSGLSFEWTVGNTIVGTDSVLVMNASDLNGQNEIKLLIANGCFEDTIVTLVNLLAQQTVNLIQDSLFVCPNDTADLFTDQVFDSLVWYGQFGQSYVDTFILSPPFPSGYIYLNAIDTNGCKTLGDSVFVESYSESYTLFADTIFACENDSALIGVVSVMDSVFWSTPSGIEFRDTFPILVDNNSKGIYQVQLMDDRSCIYIDTIVVNMQPLPVSQLPKDSMVCNQTPFVFPQSGNLQYIWDDGSTSKTFQYSQMAYYEVISPEGCFIEDSIYINIVTCSNRPPNVITANGDGVNDKFLIDEAPLFPNNHLVIMNRWGKVVFEADNYQNDFGGNDLTAGVYFFVFYRKGKGEMEDSESGEFTIIRD
jgi:hypothetical protein